MILEALERQTGSYGTVNAGDTVEVSDSVGERLIKQGTFKKASKKADGATPEEVTERNLSGLPQEPVHVDGTPREILNTTGRQLHESGPLATQEAAARVEAGVEPDLDNVPVSKGDGETTAKKAKKDADKTA